jgi:outer membrane lipoprotein-sorting protein
VNFTNRLIDASAIQGSDPLLTGGSGRLWVSPGYGLRLEIQSDNGDAQVVMHGRSFWAYDPSSNTVYEGTMPAGSSTTRSSPAEQRIPSLAEIQSALTRLSARAVVSSAMPSNVAGHAAYTVRVSPKDSGGLIGGLGLAWDAARGVPLRFDIYARGDSAPVIELSASHVSFGTVKSSVFAVNPPSGAQVEHVTLPAGASAHRSRTPAAPAAGYRFAVSDPPTLAGRARTSIKPLAGGRGALITYGTGLGAISVIEQAGAGSALPSTASSGGDRPGLSLPSVSVNGVTAQELPTALGTVLHFSRRGVSYTVIGSVSAATAQKAARSL